MSAFPDLVSRVYAEKAKSIRRDPIHANRASSLGGSCLRELVYWRTSWEKAALPDVNLQAIFKQGDLQERAALRELEDAGFRVIEQQVTLSWKEFNITGHLDAVVAIGDLALPLDVKSMAPWIWESVFFRGAGVYSWEEVAEGFKKKHWLRKYLGQLTLYMLFKAVDRALLLCINKSTGAWAQVNVSLDYAFAEELIQRAQAINRHVAEGTLPDRIPFDEKQCPCCPFYAECLPDHVGKDPLVFIDDEKLEALLEERATCEEQGKKFDQVDKRLKEIVKARPETKLSIGRFLVTKNGTPQRAVVKVETLK